MTTPSEPLVNVAPVRRFKNPDYQNVAPTLARSIDLFAMMFLSPTVSLRAAARAGVQQFGPPNGSTLTLLSNGDYSRAERYVKPQLSLPLDMRL